MTKNETEEFRQTATFRLHRKSIFVAPSTQSNKSGDPAALTLKLPKDSGYVVHFPAKHRPVVDSAMVRFRQAS